VHVILPTVSFNAAVYIRFEYTVYKNNRRETS